jgi:hypothetical protein
MRTELGDDHQKKDEDVHFGSDEEKETPIVKSKSLGILEKQPSVQ